MESTRGQYHRVPTASELDRLLHHAPVVSLKADSYRMKERLRVRAAGFQ
ncbi:MAG: ATP-binding protein [Rectinema subterraneum]